MVLTRAESIELLTLIRSIEKRLRESGAPPTPPKRSKKHAEDTE